MKAVLNTSLLALVAITLVQCSKVTNSVGKYTIKGRFLKSCSDPKPVSGAMLILHYDGGYSDAKDLQTVTTDANGNFQFSYDEVSKVLDNGLSIEGNVNYSRESYMLISSDNRNMNLDVGDFYQERNFLAAVKIRPQRITSVNDTLYYVYGGDNAPKAYRWYKKLVGPFADGQCIDTIISFHASCYNGCSSSFTDYYHWQLGENGKIQTSTAPEIPCQWQEFRIEIK